MITQNQTNLIQAKTNAKIIQNVKNKEPAKLPIRGMLMEA